MSRSNRRDAWRRSATKVLGLGGAGDLVIVPWGTASGLISAGKYQPNRGLDAAGGKKVGETSAVEVFSSAAHQSMGRERIRLDLCQRGQDLLEPRSGGPPRAVELPSWMHGRPAGSPSHQAATASAPIYALAIVDGADELDYLCRVQRLGIEIEGSFLLAAPVDETSVGSHRRAGIYKGVGGPGGILGQETQCLRQGMVGAGPLG